MPIKYPKNTSSYRGSRHHGFGTQSQHRKHGKKGGRGFTGECKHSWSWVIRFYGGHTWGKLGFNRPVCVVEVSNPINVKEVEILLPKLEAAGAAEKKGSFYEVDLDKAGYNKLLSTGAVHGKYNITVQHASDKAVEKIKNAGGSVTILFPSEEEEKEEVVSETSSDE
jgi:large subunit ribosomal protein L15